MARGLAAVLGTVVQEASENLISSRNNRPSDSGSGGPLSGAKDLLAEAGAAAAGLSRSRVRRLMGGVNGVGNIAEAPGQAGIESRLRGGERDRGQADKKGDESEGPSGIIKESAKDALAFGGGGAGKSPGWPAGGRHGSPHAGSAECRHRSFRETVIRPGDRLLPLGGAGTRRQLAGAQIVRALARLAAPLAGSGPWAAYAQGASRTAPRPAVVTRSLARATPGLWGPAARLRALCAV